MNRLAQLCLKRGTLFVKGNGNKRLLHNQTSMDRGLEPTMFVRRVVFKHPSGGPDLEVQIIKGHIAQEESDAIIYAGSSTIQSGVGKMFQLAQRGGEEFARHSREILSKRGGPLLVSEVAAIPATGLLRCKFVLHTVGPSWIDGHHGEEEMLVKTIRNALQLADKMNMKTVSMPMLCVDELCGFPKYMSAKNMLKAIDRDYFNSVDPGSRSINTIRVVEHGWVSLNVLVTEFDNMNYDTRTQREIGLVEKSDAKL